MGGCIGFFFVALFTDPLSLNVACTCPVMYENKLLMRENVSSAELNYDWFHFGSVLTSKRLYRVMLKVLQTSNACIFISKEQGTKDSGSHNVTVKKM